MEEQRQRQEEETRKTTTGTEETPTPKPQVADNEEDMLQQALAMSRTSNEGESSNKFFNQKDFVIIEC